ncbi:hypothetical protein WAI453_010925 [Rhynchosporium graminicola]
MASGLVSKNANLQGKIPCYISKVFVDVSLLPCATVLQALTEDDFELYHRLGVLERGDDYSNQESYRRLAALAGSAVMLLDRMTAD